MINIAHIHPMLVHFPIVLILLTVGLEFLVLVRRGDLTAHRCLSNVTLATLVLAALAAIAAAVFGDIALDHAAELGYPKGPMEEHGALGFSTMWFFIVYAVLYLLAWWRRFSLAGGKGWIMFLIGVVGVILMLVTAYHGGDLVYRLGINVLPVKP